MYDTLLKEFSSRYRREPELMLFCPGRVNLIGEHIDYNGGLVMPCALSLGTYLAIGRNTDQVFRFQSIDFPESAVLPLQPAYTKTGKEWFNYPLGVLNELISRGCTLPGVDMCFSGTLPTGAGLSSSASVEVIMGYAMDQLAGLQLSRQELALLCKKTENEFIGVSSGIMDQFAVALGRKDQAMLLDCGTLDYEYIPFRTGEYTLVLINSNKKRSLAESKYNERFTECRLALALLQQELPVSTLCEIHPAVFETHRHLIDDPVLEKRARHVIYEHARVKDAAVALQTGDILIFGKLLYQSHTSLQELYAVSGKELDSIVAFCRSFSGCAGARMTGAGFGGCAIALVQHDKLKQFEEGLQESYTRVNGYAPGIFTAAIADGVGVLRG